MRKSREKQRVARTWNAGNFVFPKRARALCAGISGGWWAPSACGNGTCTDRRAGATLAKLVERETDRTEGGRGRACALCDCFSAFSFLCQSAEYSFSHFAWGVTPGCNRLLTPCVPCAWRLSCVGRVALV